jgi:hypothetical protein
MLGYWIIGLITVVVQYKGTVTVQSPYSHRTVAPHLGRSESEATRALFWKRPDVGHMAAPAAPTRAKMQ